MSPCFCAPSCQQLLFRIPPHLPYLTSSQPVPHKTEPARLPKRTPNATCAHNYCTISQNNDTDSNEATQLNTSKLFGKRNKLDPPCQHRGGGGAHSVRLRRLRRRDVKNMLLAAKVSINKRLHQYPKIHSPRYICNSSIYTIDTSTFSHLPNHAKNGDQQTPNKSRVQHFSAS